MKIDIMTYQTIYVGKITSNVIQCDLSETTNRNQEFWDESMSWLDSIELGSYAWNLVVDLAHTQWLN